MADASAAVTLTRQPSQAPAATTSAAKAPQDPSINIARATSVKGNKDDVVRHAVRIRGDLFKIKRAGGDVISEAQEKQSLQGHSTTLSAAKKPVQEVVTQYERDLALLAGILIAKKDDPVSLAKLRASLSPATLDDLPTHADYLKVFPRQVISVEEAEAAEALDLEALGIGDSAAVDGDDEATAAAEEPDPLDFLAEPVAASAPLPPTAARPPARAMTATRTAAPATEQKGAGDDATAATAALSKKHQLLSPLAVRSPAALTPALAAHKATGGSGSRRQSHSLAGSTKSGGSARTAPASLAVQQAAAEEELSQFQSLLERQQHDVIVNEQELAEYERAQDQAIEGLWAAIEKVRAQRDSEIAKLRDRIDQTRRKKDQGVSDFMKRGGQARIAVNRTEKRIEEFTRKLLIREHMIACTEQFSALQELREAAAEQGVDLSEVERRANLRRGSHSVADTVGTMGSSVLLTLRDDDDDETPTGAAASGRRSASPV